MAHTGPAGEAAMAAASAGAAVGGTSDEVKDDGASPCLRMDVHTHILPRTWPDLKDRYGYGGFIKLDHHHECKARMMRDDGTFFREVGKRTWDPDTRIAESNRIRMNVQVLSTVPVMFSYWAKPEDALDVSQMLNDHIAGCVSANPTRFVGLGTLPMQDPDLACDELKRCVNELGLKGEFVASRERLAPACRCKSPTDATCKRTPPNDAPCRPMPHTHPRFDRRMISSPCRCGDRHSRERLDAL